MAIKIHHGPPGSYKTSGAIQDDAVRALKDGRVIITNVRGFTLDRVYEVFPETPESTKIINLSLEELSDLEKMRNWFMWVPHGAFIIFDEVQIVFPKSWREADLKKFDFVGGPDAAKEANRPMGWLDAWTRHRHFGWDVVLTTPNISYVRDDIRMAADVAYRHSNMANIGLKGRYKEAQHDAQLNRPPEKGTIVEYKKIKPQTFKLYQSTATGTFSDTISGKSLLRSPKLLLLLLVLGYLFYSIVTSSRSDLLGGSDSQVSIETSSTPHQTIASNRSKVDQVSDSLASNASVRRSNPKVLAELLAEKGPYDSMKFSIIGSIKNSSDRYTYIFRVYDDRRSFTLTDKQLHDAGYRLRKATDCSVLISGFVFETYAVCEGQGVRAASGSSRNERANDLLITY